MGSTTEDRRLDAVFTALSDRTRRDIVARLSVGEATVNELLDRWLDVFDVERKTRAGDVSKVKKHI